MPATSATPTYNLEQLVDWTRDPSSKVGLCHIWGIFVEEIQSNNSSYWKLKDEHCHPGVRIMLPKLKDKLPKVRPGYIVRIHRLSIDSKSKEPIITSDRNVVVWPAFKFNPTPVTTASRPTLTDQDIERHRQLEVLFARSLYKVREIKQSLVGAGKTFCIAGKVLYKQQDMYGHYLLDFCDETGRSQLRIFKNIYPKDSDEHYKVAESLQLNDLFVATGAKLDDKGRLCLSTNLYCGRSLSKVESASILGTTMTESLATIIEDIPSTSSVKRTLEEDPVVPNKAPPPNQPLRRSPRINELQSSQTSSSSSQYESPANISIQSSTTDEFPQYTQLSDIKIDGSYSYHDLAGQVRGTPNKTREHENWVFQFYDGSKHDLRSFHIDEVKQPVPDCVVIFVYKPAGIIQSETDQHIKKAQSLKEGDLVLIKNVRVQFRDGRVKFEMQSNLQHGKSINVISKTSRFGIEIENKVTNPFVDDNGTQETVDDIDVAN